MEKFELKQPVTFFKKHGRTIMFGAIILFLIIVISACLFLIFGPTSSQDIIRVQGRKQTTVNVEEADALLKKLDTRAPSGYVTTQNPFLNTEGLTIISDTQ